ncbi:aminotransferase class V-fold PLP-dependent enzyme [Klebsiella variicola subsp. variicola]|nr:aminotransferase class V-fold PLP-dependent enzyme [Klebsiella variicola subsp. variicola]
MNGRTSRWPPCSGRLPQRDHLTSCATEATTTAIASAVALMPERREIITSVVEHPATLAVCEQLERRDT